MGGLGRELGILPGGKKALQNAVLGVSKRSPTALLADAARDAIKVVDKPHTPNKKIKAVVQLAGATDHARPGVSVKDTLHVSGSTRHGTPGATPRKGDLTVDELSDSGAEEQLKKKNSESEAERKEIAAPVLPPRPHESSAPNLHDATSAMLSNQGTQVAPEGAVVPKRRFVNGVGPQQARAVRARRGPKSPLIPLEKTTPPSKPKRVRIPKEPYTPSTTKKELKFTAKPGLNLTHSDSQMKHMKWPGVLKAAKAAGLSEDDINKIGGSPSKRVQRLKAHLRKIQDK